MDPLYRNNVHVVGRPDALRTLVFVHGFGTNQDAWREVAAPFAADSRIVLLDNVGAGDSAPEAFVQHRYLGLATYASDLLEVSRALKLDGAVFVGHSVGAMIALLAAVQEPAHCGRLVLIGASPRYLDEPGYRGGFSSRDLAQIYRAVAENYAGWTDAFAPAMMDNPDRPGLARHLADSLKTIPQEHALTVLCSIFQSDHRADLGRVTQPTLILQSRRDSAVPSEVAEYLHRSIAGSELEVLAADGHLPHLAAPGVVIAAMQRFLGPVAA